MNTASYPIENGLAVLAGAAEAGFVFEFDMEVGPILQRKEEPSSKMAVFFDHQNEQVRVCLFSAEEEYADFTRLLLNDWFYDQMDNEYKALAFVFACETYQKGFAKKFIEAIQKDPERVKVAIDEAWRKHQAAEAV